jgi:hypothetical protein
METNATYRPPTRPDERVRVTADPPHPDGGVAIFHPSGWSAMVSETDIERDAKEDTMNKALQYTAIVHTPGCLPDDPESNVATFDTLGEARGWLAAEIERDWDAAYERADSPEQAIRLGDEVYLEAHTEVNHLQPGDSIQAGGYSYEIQTT